ncbi:Threonine/homoserine exporter RhtA [compost metagenome]
MFAPELLPVLLGVAVLSSAFPYTLEMYALTRIPTRTFGTLMSLEPAIAAMSGLIFLGEQLTPIQWVAIGAIILASAGTTLSSQPSHPAPVPTPD